MRTWGNYPPVVEVRISGEWCTAALAQREDRASGVIYHLDVQLPGEVGPVRRTYVYDPASIRRVGDPGGPPVDTLWDAEGRITKRTHPPAS
jgi:hypothetical protein